MDPLVARVRRTVRRFSLFPPGSRVLVAVSGGADSMALLHALRDLERAGEVDVAGIAHLHHGLRGVAADEDEAFCRTVAERFGLPFDCEHVDVGAVADERAMSIEAAGHAVRYEFLERAAGRLDASCVALGHTRDDQAETFLLRLFRGAGPRGLGGIHPRAGPFVRPMLDCSRRLVRQFVAARTIAFREDSTNRDVAIARNLVRHEIVPFLARVWPGTVRVLARDAQIARDDADFLDAAARAAFERLAEHDGGPIRLEAEALRQLAPAVARRVVAMAVSALAAGRFIGFDHIERVLDLVGGARPGSVDLPGQCVEYDGSYVLFTGGGATRPGGVFPGEANFFPVSLSIPGEVVSPFGWVLSAERATLQDGAGPPAPTVESDGDRRTYPRSWAVLDARALLSPLVVRGWQPGDRVRLLGMTGTRKLQDVFVDRKVPRERRPHVPIVIDGGGRIAWVAGHAIAEDFRVTPATSDVVILKLKYWRHGT